MKVKKNVYIVLTELTSIFNERTTCSEDILFRLEKLRDLLNTDSQSESESESESDF